MGSQERVRAATKATAETDTAVTRACAMLERYRDWNGLGIYAHPHALRAHLTEAREAIAHAEEIISTASWPDDEDYDVA